MLCFPFRSTSMSHLPVLLFSLQMSFKPFQFHAHIFQDSTHNPAHWCVSCDKILYSNEAFIAHFWHKHCLDHSSDSSTDHFLLSHQSSPSLSTDSSRSHSTCTGEKTASQQEKNTPSDTRTLSPPPGTPSPLFSCSNSPSPIKKTVAKRLNFE